MLFVTAVRVTGRVTDQTVGLTATGTWRRGRRRGPWSRGHPMVRSWSGTRGARGRRGPSHPPRQSRSPDRPLPGSRSRRKEILPIIINIKSLSTFLAAIM